MFGSLNVVFMISIVSSSFYVCDLIWLLMIFVFRKYLSLWMIMRNVSDVIVVFMLIDSDIVMISVFEIRLLIIGSRLMMNVMSMSVFDSGSCWWKIGSVMSR